MGEAGTWVGTEAPTCLEAGVLHVVGTHLVPAQLWAAGQPRPLQVSSPGPGAACLPSP